MIAIEYVGEDGLEHEAIVGSDYLAWCFTRGLHEAGLEVLSCNRVHDEEDEEPLTGDGKAYCRHGMATEALCHIRSDGSCPLDTLPS
jgi:hypothetical protein